MGLTTSRQRNVVVAGCGNREFEMSLEEVERYLTDDKKPGYRRAKDGQLRWHTPAAGDDNHPAHAGHTLAR